MWWWWRWWWWRGDVGGRGKMMGGGLRGGGGRRCIARTGRAVFVGIRGVLETCLHWWRRRFLDHFIFGVAVQRSTKWAGQRRRGIHWHQFLSRSFLSPTRGDHWSAPLFFSVYFRDGTGGRRFFFVFLSWLHLSFHFFLFRWLGNMKFLFSRRWRVIGL